MPSFTSGDNVSFSSSSSSFFPFETAKRSYTCTGKSTAMEQSRGILSIPNPKTGSSSPQTLPASFACSSTDNPSAFMACSLVKPKFFQVLPSTHLAAIPSYRPAACPKKAPTSRATSISSSYYRFRIVQLPKKPIKLYHKAGETAMRDGEIAGLFHERVIFNLPPLFAHLLYDNAFQRL